MTRAAAPVAVARQNLGRAADAAPEGFIERDAANLPTVRLASPIDLPLRGPAELPIIPDQSPGQNGLRVLLGCYRRKRRQWRRPERLASDVRFRQCLRPGQHDKHATLVSRGE